MTDISPRPRFSLISAVYNVAEYLPEFLASIDEQGDALQEVELLLVSDGSPDDSERIIEEWQRSSRARARLLRKENGGAGSARNFGLDHATGDWVSFPDPDDVLAPGYLERLVAAARQADQEGADIIAAKVEQFSDDPRRAVDNHILGYRYRGEQRIVDLETNPTYFHAHVSSGLYRRSVIERAGVRFDPRLRVAFDDATFAAEYALAVERPRMLVVPGASYLYRRRVDGSSLVGTMWSKPAKYTEVPRYGYLRLLEQRDEAPRWLQALVMYDLEWFFREHLNPAMPNRRMDPETRAEFLALLDPILQRVDIDMLAAFPLHPLERDIRIALSARKTGALPWNEGRFRELENGTWSITIYAASADDRIDVTRDGLLIEPSRLVREPIAFYGEEFCQRVTVVVPSEGTVVVRCAGAIVPLFASVGDRYLGAFVSTAVVQRATRSAPALTRAQHLRAAVPTRMKRVARPVVLLARSARGSVVRITRRVRPA